MIHDGIHTGLVRPGMVTDFALPESRETLRTGDEVLSFIARNLEPYRRFHIFMRTLPALLAARPRAQVLIVDGHEVSYGRRLASGQT